MVDLECVDLPECILLYIYMYVYIYICKNHIYIYIHSVYIVKQINYDHIGMCNQEDLTWPSSELGAPTYLSHGAPVSCKILSTGILSHGAGMCWFPVGDGCLKKNINSIVLKSSQDLL